MWYTVLVGEDRRKKESQTEGRGEGKAERHATESNFFEAFDSEDMATTSVLGAFALVSGVNTRPERLKSFAT